MYSILVYIAIFGSILIYTLLLLVPYLFILLLPKKPRAHWMRFLTLYLGRTVILALRPFVRIRYEKPANDSKQAGIYVLNHRSALDAFLVALFGKEVIQIVNGWPMKLPFFGFNARQSGYIDSTHADLNDTLNYARELISQGVSIIAFPEGTRSGSTTMNAFHSGIFLLARELQVPLYPCCIAGNEQFPDRKFRFHPTRKILVKKLPPILPEDYNRYPSAFVFKKQVHAIIAQETATMDQIINSSN